MKVKDFMIRNVISVHPNTTVKELLILLNKHRIGGVPVIDDNNKLVGMVSDGDAIRYLTPKEKTVHDFFYTVYVEEGETEDQVLEKKKKTPINEMMNKKQIYTVNEDDEFEIAIRILSKHHFKKLPVLNSEDKVTGVISRGDIIYNLSKRLTD